MVSDWTLSFRPPSCLRINQYLVANAWIIYPPIHVHFQPLCVCASYLFQYLHTCSKKVNITNLSAAQWLFVCSSAYLTNLIISLHWILGGTYTIGNSFQTQFSHAVQKTTLVIFGKHTCSVNLCILLMIKIAGLWVFVVLLAEIHVPKYLIHYGSWTNYSSPR